MTDIRRQRGVALIFALGILSLILVMGVAFVGNALISQKIAVNSSEGASARLVARSALDRAMAQLTLFNLIQSGRHADYYASDASSVFSRLDPASSAPTAQDQLTGADSKLNVDTKYGTSWYAGSGSLAKWIYVHQNGVESDGAQATQTANPIIARYAYQVLPQTSDSRLSLYAVTSGVTGIAGETPAATNPRIPHTHRWGIDVDELVIPGLNNMFATYWGDGATLALTPQHEFDNFQNLLSGSSAPNPFYGGDREIENRKRWLRHIFVEGKGRVAREACFDGVSKWYPRFNLSAFTPFFAGNATEGTWYSRFLSSVPGSAAAEQTAVNALKNSAGAVSALGRTPAASDVFHDSHVRDRDYGSPIGLPFLKRIGSNTEKGAFDTIENFRKQIAANLNDYCDADSVPTSDVAASTWGNTGVIVGTSPAPSYTGNEKTLYINEIAFGFKLYKSKLEKDGARCVFRPATSSWGPYGNRMKAEIIAELVEIYRGLPASYQTMNLRGRLNALTVQFRVSIKGKVKIKRQGEDDVVEVDLGESGVSTTADVSLAAVRDFNISSFTRNNGYWLGRLDLNEYMNIASIDLTDAIKAQDGHGKNITVEDIGGISHIKVEVLKVTFNLGNLALYLQDLPSSPTVANYVDFVRVAPGNRETVPTSPVNVFEGGDGWLEKSKLSDETGSSSGKCFFYAGSMQAIDPRQNLWAKQLVDAGGIYENDPTSDWRTEFTPTLASSTSGSPVWTSLDSRRIGARNVYSTPSAPANAAGTAMVPGTNCDYESAGDPAWLGDTAGQHISTAVIRNKPMRSPWELGFIHRGIPFQTINLKRAGSIDGTGTLLADDAHKRDNFDGWGSVPGTETGTTYAGGDAGILDQIKMTEYNKSYGKVDLQSLYSSPACWVSAAAGGSLPAAATLSNSVFLGLFQNLRRQTPAQFLYESDNLKSVPAASSGGGFVWEGATVSPNPASSWSVGAVGDVKLRSQLLNDSGMSGISAFSGAPALDNDAAKEEFIGKTINLTEARSCSVPNVFRIIIVAQTIRDQTGSVVRLDSSNTQQTETAAIGRFDAAIGANLDSSVYFDEILSECRMLATVEKIFYMDGDTPRVRLRVKQIEYLD